VASTDFAISGAAENGATASTDTLFSALYTELHRMARRELARQWNPASLSVTTLLHEAYLDMSERDGTLFPDQARFMGYATRVMRGLIIDHARRRSADKRGGQFEIMPLEDDVPEAADIRQLSAISEVLDELARVEPELAQVVDLKFFCGFSFAEIAVLHDVSERTVQRRWEKAREHLHQRISGGRPI